MKYSKEVKNDHAGNKVQIYTNGVTEGMAECGAGALMNVERF